MIIKNSNLFDWLTTSLTFSGTLAATAGAIMLGLIALVFWLSIIITTIYGTIFVAIPYLKLKRKELEQKLKDINKK